MFKKFLFVTILSGLLWACRADSTPRQQTLVAGGKNILPSPEMPLICQGVIEFIENHNFKKVNFGDSLANIVYDNYIKSLDPARLYFLQSDIDEFAKQKENFTKDLRRGELSLPFYIFNVYLKRYTDNYTFAKSQLSKNLQFSDNDVYVYNRENLPWLKSKAEVQNLWKRKVGYDQLSLLIGDSGKKTTQTSKSTNVLSKRYQNLIKMANQLNNQDVFQLFMASVTNAVDPHTSYFNPQRAQDFNESISLSMEGIGAQLKQSDDAIEITRVIPGGPAFKQKILQVGDKIVGVAQGNGEFEDIVGWRLDRAVRKIKGPKNTIVRLKIIPSGKSVVSKPEIVTITRDKIIIDDGAKKVIQSVKSSDGTTYKVGIIELPSFYFDVKGMQAGGQDYKSTTEDVTKILDTLKNKDHVNAVILDLRGNGGGSLLEVIKLVGLFTGKGPVVQVKDTKGIEISKSKNAVLWDGPLGVITDRLSASASEIFAGAIQDYGRGIIMGSNTFGKGTVQTTIDLNKVFAPNVVDKMISMIKTHYKVDPKLSGTNENQVAFGQLNLTIAKFYRISGSSTQEKGVIPDILFPSIYDEKELGETSEPSALPWDTVPSANYHKKDISALIAQLKTFHQERMKNSVDLKILNQIIQNNTSKKKETTLPVSFQKLKQYQDSLEQRELHYTNEIRLSRGLKPLKKGEKKPEDKHDFELNECVKIMGDMIRISQQAKAAEMHVPAA